MAYPEGTSAAGSQVQVLTDHIRICEKHPMRKAEAKISKLRKALSDLIGAENKDELEKMELALRMTQAPDADKVAAINAIHILIETGSDQEAINDHRP